MGFSSLAGGVFSLFLLFVMLASHSTQHFEAPHPLQGRLCVPNLETSYKLVYRPIVIGGLSLVENSCVVAIAFRVLKIIMCWAQHIVIIVIILSSSLISQSAYYLFWNHGCFAVTRSILTIGGMSILTSPLQHALCDRCLSSVASDPPSMKSHSHVGL